ncbi:hypothetical protein SELMODRAFT_432230 [Selaginella moellendorffii]|uniref:Uncharacterized protein n=1 Tax=Selaginella moellendorffii TaxID=88036 RepID=D8TFD3_SELML|nr:hypothetical protein SELMODRAFT_432230 [Selaginella moellendorffii]
MNLSIWHKPIVLHRRYKSSKASRLQCLLGFNQNLSGAREHEERASIIACGKSTSELQSAVREDLKLLPVLKAGTMTRIKVLEGGTKRKRKKFSPTVHFSGYGPDECQTNDVHIFDFGMYTWSKPVMKGTHPSPRDSHSSTAVGSKLYVFGGTDGTSPLDNLFVLDNATSPKTSGFPTGVGSCIG